MFLYLFTVLFLTFFSLYLAIIKVSIYILYWHLLLALCFYISVYIETIVTFNLKNL